MKIAFLISAFMDMEHLERLIGSLPEGGDVYVHLDKASPQPPVVPRRGTEGLPPPSGRVVFIAKRFRVMFT